MMRMASSRSVKHTNSRRLLSECPMMISLNSSSECSSSSKMAAIESRNTVAAYSKLTPRFAMLAVALLTSHSKCKLICSRPQCFDYLSFCIQPIRLCSSVPTMVIIRTTPYSNIQNLLLKRFLKYDKICF